MSAEFVEFGSLGVHDCIGDSQWWASGFGGCILTVASTRCNLNCNIRLTSGVLHWVLWYLLVANHSRAEAFSSGEPHLFTVPSVVNCRGSISTSMLQEAKRLFTEHSYHGSVPCAGQGSNDRRSALSIDPPPVPVAVDPLI